ncbi:MAG: DrmE family protein [Candidatus Helarchaeota archaeon]
MESINKYLNSILVFAEKKLKEYFDISNLEFNNFEIINSFLIYQTIKNSKINSLIYFPDKKSKSKFYIPSIFILALYNFIDNYLDDSTDVEIGCIVQKDGERYEVTEISNEMIILKKHDKYQTKITTTKKNIRTYIITTAPLKNRKVKIKFDLYKQFFSEILSLKEECKNNDKLPSKFKYKSLIVADKKIIDELKKYKINGKKIHRAFPFQYITKNGKVSNNIPIDPMIYIVNDYATAKTFILNRDIEIQNIIIIGTNKYKDNLLELSESLNNNMFKNCVLIGNYDIPDTSIPNLYKWKWTLPELNYFNYFSTYEIKKEIVNDEILTRLLSEFDNFVKEIEEEYYLNLKELYKYVRNILPITIISPKSNLINQLCNLLDHFEKEGNDIVESAFIEIDEWDFEKIWEEILIIFKKIIEHQKNNILKYQKLQEYKKIDYLVVPKEAIGIWETEINSDHIRNVISFKNFQNLEVCNKIVVFLGFYGMKHLKSILYNPNKINLIIYPQENEYYNRNFNKFKNETYNELKRKDRKVISEISFSEIEKFEDVSDLILRLFEQSESDRIDSDYSDNYSSNLSYELTFEDDNEILVLDENKTVLIKKDTSEKEEKVKNLKIGDKIRVYDNSTKEELYEVALESDEKGLFKDIEKFSRLWKMELFKFSKRFSTIEFLLYYLREKGLSITNELTLKNWININSSVKFPQKNKDLIVLKKNIDSEKLNQNFKEIIKHRRIYNGIMIALGRDLSDEISDYIKNGLKGNILSKFTKSQIQNIIDKSAKLRVIKTIKVANDE